MRHASMAPTPSPREPGRALRSWLRRVSPGAWAAIGVFVLALVVRVLWVAWVDSPYDNIFSDMGGYINRAKQAAYGAGDPAPIFVAFYPPGTHLIYAAQMLLVGWTRHAPFLLLHCAWGAAVAPCATLLALRIVPRLPVVIAVGVIGAVWEPLLSFTGYFSSEQPDAGLLALSAWLLVRQIEGKRTGLALGASTALAYLVRPQIVLTVAALGLAWVVGTVMRRSWARPRWTRLLVAAALLASAVGFGAVRYHALAGRWGLISDNSALARLFADTNYGTVKAATSDDTGKPIGEFFFAPPSKVQTGERRELYFHGYLGDTAILERARREEVARMTVGDRLVRWGNNVSLLFVHNTLWPEDGRLGSSPWRSAYSDATRAVLLALVCPLALLGLLACLRRPTATLVVVGAHVLTAILTAAFFCGEQRYRVPYDVFLLLLALEGARGAAPVVARWLSSPVPAA
jgi:hypothetical protein